MIKRWAFCKAARRVFWMDEETVYSLGGFFFGGTPEYIGRYHKRG